jgi:choline-glycine betaine transporter
VVNLIWFAIFGGAAVSIQRAGTDLASESPEAQLLGVIEAYPLGAALGVIATVLVSIFFVSGADAASVVMGTLSQRGSLCPSRGIVVLWGVVMGAIAAVMLLVGGDDALTGIQNLTIIMAVPFGLVMVLLCVALTEDLRHDPLMRRHDRSQRAVEQALDCGMETYGDRFFLNVESSPAAASPQPVEVDDNHQEEVSSVARAMPRS